MIYNQKPTTAIILAGGLGTRIKHLNPNSPKPMILINKIPFLEYLLTYLIHLGINTFILQVCYQHKIIQGYFGEWFKGAKLIYEIEDIPMGTGGGLILSDYKYNNSHVLVINGDTFTEFNYKKFFKFHLYFSSGLSLICRKDKIIKSSLKFSLDRNSNLYFTKKKNILMNCGVYLIKKNVLNKFLRLRQQFISFESDILFPMIKDKKVSGYLENKFFIDIGTPLDYKLAQNIIPEHFKNRGYL